MILFFLYNFSVGYKYLWFVIYGFFVRIVYSTDTKVRIAFFLVLVQLTRLFWLNGFEALNIIRYYWGWSLIYFFFYERTSGISRRLVLVLISLVLLEAIALNTIIDARVMPNFPTYEDAWTHFAPKGSYQRPYSFAGNGTVLGVILVLFFQMYHWKIVEKIFIILAIAASASGTAYLFFALTVFMRLRIGYRLVLALVTIWLVESNIVWKVSLEYLNYLVKFKLDQIDILLNWDCVIWGCGLESSKLSLGGDFAILSFLEFNGVVGIVLLISISFLMLRDKTNRTVVGFLLLTLIHYGTIFAYAGQLVFASLLASDSKSGQYDK